MTFTNPNVMPPKDFRKVQTIDVAPSQFEQWFALGLFTGPHYLPVPLGRRTLPFCTKTVHAHAGPAFKVGLPLCVLPNLQLCLVSFCQFCLPP